MKKGLKDKLKVTGKQPKEFVPSNYPHLRECILITTPNQSDRQYKPENPPRILPNEFDYALVNELLSETESKLNPYTDSAADHIILPDSLYSEYLNKEIKWSRPDEYIKENLLDKEIIMRFPNRNKFKFRAKVKEMYEQEKEEKESGVQKPVDLNDNFFNEEEKDKYSLYRDFFNIINSNPVIRVVNYYTREETNEEYEIRMKTEEDELLAKAKKDPKAKNYSIKKKTTKIDEPIEKKVIKSISPSNISMKDGYPIYCRWLASIFQVIKDRNILDVFTKETIWQKIYPQEEGVPMYNPKGLYIVKLYHMGKLRQIEIDDTMPVSRYDEFYLPKCELLNEIWPAILTKAIIKLFSYKIVSSSFQELGDYEAFYALTGLMPRMLDVVLRDKITNDQLNVVKEALTDDNYLTKNCYFLCYRKENEIKREEDKELFLGQQGIYNKNDALKSATKFNHVFHQLKRMKTIIRSSQSLVELKQLQMNNKLPAQLHHFVDDIDNNAPYRKQYLKRKSINNTKQTLFLKPMKPEGEKEDEINPSRESNRLGTIYQSSLKQGMEKYENKIFIGLLYDVIEFFDNREFNMNRLKPIDFSDLKDMIKQLNTTYVFKQLSREEKKIYLENLKDIKQKQKTEKIKRIEELKLKGFSFKCIKIRNFSVEEPKFYIPYADEEIEMTKKCLLNNWEFPPIEFLNQIYEDKIKFDLQDLPPSSPKKRASILMAKNTSSQSPNKNTGLTKTFLGEKNKQSGNVVNFTQMHNQIDNERTDLSVLGRDPRTWSRDVYMQLVNNDLQQFNKQIDPVIRPKGTWVSPEEFFNCFNSFLLLGNPKMLRNCLDWDNNWYNINDDFNIDESKKIIHFSLNEDPNIKMLPYIVIMFSANADKMNKFRDISYQINFTLLENNKETNINKQKVFSTFSLKSFYETKHFKLDQTKEYLLKCEGGIYPNGFFLRIISDFKMEGLSEQTYLTQYLNYQKLTYKIEHNIIEKNTPHQLFRLLIQINQPLMIMLITNQKDNYAINFTECLLINTKTNNKRIIERNHLIKIDNVQGKEYVITINITPPFNLQEESYDIDVLYDNQNGENTIAQIENIPPYDIYDYYIPNKHYLLFQEYVFSGDKVYAMLNVKLIRIIQEDCENNDNKAIVSKGNKDKQNANMSQIKQMPIEDTIRMKLVLLNKDNELINSWDFFNEITIQNIIFEGNVLVENKKDKSSNAKGNTNKEDNSPPGNLPYLLKCYMDKSELPRQYQSAENVNRIGWSIRIHASDTIAFCKNTTKEDKERAMMSGWEAVEPGRSERAQQSRRRFLLQKQKLEGIEIGKEDEAFLSIPFQRKILLQTTTQPETLTRNKNRKETKSKHKLQKTEIDLTIKNDELDMNKKLPDINCHASLYAKNFLFYTYNDRLIQYDHNYPQEESKNK